MGNQTNRERRQERTRDAILAAALELVSKGGMEALSMREVARRVEYSPAGLYEYFGSKEEIVAAVVAEGYRRFAAHLSRVSVDLPVDECLIEIGAAYLDFARTYPQHYLLMFTGLTEWWVEGKPKVDERGSYQLLVDTLARGIAQGVFVPRAGFGLDEMAYSCWSLVHGMAMLQLNQLQGVQETLKEQDRDIIRNNVYGMTRPR